MVRVRRAGLARARTRLSDEASTALSDGAPATEEVAASGDARERILDAAEDLFAADGFDATPTARIARRAAVAKGLLFYYFPRKTDLLRTLFAERLPAQPLTSIVGIAVPGDMAGSLVRLAERIGLTRHHSQVLSEILFREASTHPDVRDHLRALHTALMDLTEATLDAASPRKLDHGRRKAAAGTFVAVLLHEANFHRFGGPVPNLDATAEIVSRGLLA
ncbi:MAG: TetR/AcrR family transcriptional regulator [Dermatophilaceae bacterium]